MAPADRTPSEEYAAAYARIWTPVPPSATTPASWPDLRALANANYDGDGLHYFTKAHAAQLRALLAHVDGGPDA